MLAEKTGVFLYFYSSSIMSLPLWMRDAMTDDYVIDSIYHCLPGFPLTLGWNDSPQNRFFTAVRLCRAGFSLELWLDNNELARFLVSWDQDHLDLFLDQDFELELFCRPSSQPVRRHDPHIDGDPSSMPISLGLPQQQSFI